MGEVLRPTMRYTVAKLHVSATRGHTQLNLGARQEDEKDNNPHHYTATQATKRKKNTNATIFTA